MPRTTINLDGPILRDLKRLQKKERKSLGRLISDLVARALAAGQEGESRRRTLSWKSKPMQARIDWTDKEALHAALDRD